MKEAILKYLKWMLYATVIFFALTGAGLTIDWPGRVKLFWYDTLLHKWLISKQTLNANNEAPAFILEDLKGNKLSLAGYRGRPVMITFWATWCPPCREEIPMLAKLYNDYGKRGVEILAITGEKKWMVEGFLANEASIPYKILLDDGNAVQKLYRVSSIPVSLVVDSKGVIHHKKIGYDKDNREKAESEYRKLIEQLLNK